MCTALAPQQHFVSAEVSRLEASELKMAPLSSIRQSAWRFVSTLKTETEAQRFLASYEIVDLCLRNRARQNTVGTVPREAACQKQ